MIEDLTFLEEGEFTATDERIDEISRSLHINQGVCREISRYIRRLSFDDSQKARLFRKRNASEIIESGYVTGCTDKALVFIALSRQLGIPTKFVETFKYEWLKNPESPVKGHVLAKILVNNAWLNYDPVNGLNASKGYFEAGDGLDFSQIYLKCNGVYQSRPIRIQTIEDMRKVARIVLGGRK